VVQHAAAGRHAARRDDDHRPGALVQALRLLGTPQHLQVLRRQRRRVLAQQPLHVEVVILGWRA